MDKPNVSFTQEIIEKLTSLPHRGATTKNEKIAADYVKTFIQNLGAKPTEQSFKTSITYIYEIWWMLGILLVGLALLPYYTIVGFGIVTGIVLTLFLYFDWRGTFVTSMPPQKESQNIIGTKNEKADAKNRLVLMAHYDSAPVSLLYLPSQVAGFSKSLKFNLFNIFIVQIIAILYVLGIPSSFGIWFRIIYMVYFAAQTIITSLDYFRLGYTNGAADNASGVAVALSTAQKLWQNYIPDWNIEVVITGAEEVGMRGAKYYFKTNHQNWNDENVHLLNFDNVGIGDIKIITKTGSLTQDIYDNDLTKAALETVQTYEKYNDIKTGEWHTGDFDSIYFKRAGLSALTLSAQDENGLIPNLHRPSDTIENVDFTIPERASEFAFDVCMHLIKKVKVD